MEQESQMIQGTVLAVIYQNPENGYSVLKLRTEDGELVTVVGTIPMTIVGERLVVPILAHRIVSNRRPRRICAAASMIVAASGDRFSTASAMPNPPAAPALANTAAPGVLQATMTGFFRIRDGTAVHRPMPSPSAHIHELICAGVAPNASAA